MKKIRCKEKRQITQHSKIAHNLQGHVEEIFLEKTHVIKDSFDPY